MTVDTSRHRAHGSASDSSADVVAAAPATVWPGRLLYNFILAAGLLITFPVWAVYVLTTPKVRTGFLQKIGIYPSEVLDGFRQLRDDVPCIWIHAVSVGEFNAVRPLIVSLLEQSYQLVVSTTTTTGQELARKVLPKTVPVFYCPFDLPATVQQLLRLVRPSALLLTETELWPNLIFEAADAGVPVLLINGRLSPRSFTRYRLLRPLLMKPLLHRMERLLMQSQGDADRMLALGAPAEKVQALGNIKFDINAHVDPQQVEAFRQMFGFDPTATVLTAASTHPGEEELVAETFIRLRKNFPTLKLVIAPRHPERVEKVRKLLNNRALRYSLRSELNEDVQSAQPIVVLDTIGELLTVFALSDAVIMGGSFVPAGGHNVLEPLSQQVPVVYGPYMFNFPEINRWLLEHRAAVQVETLDELVSTLTGWLTQPEKTAHLVENGQRLLMQHRGIKDQLVTVINQLVVANQNKVDQRSSLDTATAEPLR